MILAMQHSRIKKIYREGSIETKDKNARHTLAKSFASPPPELIVA